MTPEYLGQFLLRRGEIDEAQLQQAFELMEQLNPPLGARAVAAGFATEADCRRVNDEQRRTDLPFGELAMQMGVLNGVELEELLAAQQASRVDLTAALVRLGTLADDRARQLRDEWKSERSTVPESPELPDRLAAHPAASLAIGLVTRMLQRVAGMRAALGSAAPALPRPDRLLVANVTCTGTRPLTLSLVAEPRFAERLARGLLGMDLDALAPELALDAVGEFLNLLLGNVACTLATEGRSLRLGPPCWGVLPSSGWSFEIVTENDGSASLVVELPPESD